MSIMPNEPLVRLAPASHWNLRNELAGWSIFSGIKAKPFHLLAQISLLLSVLHKINIPHDTYFLLVVPCRWFPSPYAFQTKLWRVQTSFCYSYSKLVELEDNPMSYNTRGGYCHLWCPVCPPSETAHVARMFPCWWHDEDILIPLLTSCKNPTSHVDSWSGHTFLPTRKC